MNKTWFINIISVVVCALLIYYMGWKFILGFFIGIIITAYLAATQTTMLVGVTKAMIDMVKKDGKK